MKVKISYTDDNAGKAVRKLREEQACATVRRAVVAWLYGQRERAARQRAVDSWCSFQAQN